VVRLVDQQKAAQIRTGQAQFGTRFAYKIVVIVEKPPGHVGCTTAPRRQLPMQSNVVSLHLRASAVFFLGVAMAGCGPVASAWAGVFAALLWIGALLIQGCAACNGCGYEERCCRDGRLTTCFCPAGEACNYGEFLQVCDDGTCGYGESREMVCGAGDGGVSDASAGDAGPGDAGGTYQPCCEGGRLTTCFCPAGAICNYAPWEDCGGGRCVYYGETCPDAGS
jgi:hypothetical protein